MPEDAIAKLPLRAFLPGRGWVDPATGEPADPPAPPGKPRANGKPLLDPAADPTLGAPRGTAISDKLASPKPPAEFEAPEAEAWRTFLKHHGPLAVGELSLLAAALAAAARARRCEAEAEAAGRYIPSRDGALRPHPALVQAGHERDRHAAITAKLLSAIRARQAEERQRTVSAARELRRGRHGGRREGAGRKPWSPPEHSVYNAGKR